MNSKSTTKQLQDVPMIPTFGYELILDVVFPDLFGADTKNILYLAGKRLARKYPQETIDDLMMFFEQTGWGQLSMKKSTTTTLQFVLTGELVKERMSHHANCSFQLEAGFLAEQVQRQKQCITEAVESRKRRSRKVIFTVQSDIKDSLS